MLLRWEEVSPNKINSVEYRSRIPPLYEEEGVL